MKIAQIAPLIERVPPRLYGGTERIVFYLTEEVADEPAPATRLRALVDSIAPGDFDQRHRALVSSEIIRCETL